MTREFIDLIEVEAAAAADWLASKEIREEFRGNRERYMAYRRAAARGRVRALDSAGRGAAIEAAGDAARRGGNIDSAAIGLFKANANVRQVFGDVMALVDHLK